MDRLITFIEKNFTELLWTLIIVFALYGLSSFIASEVREDRELKKLYKQAEITCIESGKTYIGGACVRIVDDK